MRWMRSQMSLHNSRACHVAKVQLAIGCCGLHAAIEPMDHKNYANLNLRRDGSTRTDSRVMLGERGGCATPLYIIQMHSALL
jgi:hypothetical protein